MAHTVSVARALSGTSGHVAETPQRATADEPAMATDHSACVPKKYALICICI